MKRKSLSKRFTRLLSMFITLALILTMLIGESGLLVFESSASNFPATLNEPIFQETQFTAPSSVTIVSPPNVEVWYTTATGSGNTSSGTLSPGMTITDWMHNDLRRHDGGVFPFTTLMPHITLNDDNDIRGHSGGLTITGIHPSATLYNGPITIPAQTGNATFFTISAIAVRREGGNIVEISDPVTRSYLRGTNRWSNTTNYPENLMIFSIYSDARGIFGFDEGLYGLGKDRDEWIDAFLALPQNSTRTRTWITSMMNDPPTQGLFPPTVAANFTRRGRGGGERSAHVEMFDPRTGTQYISQWCGIRTKGGWSRGTFVNEQKTFELYGRNMWGSDNRFLFPIFGEQNSVDGSGNLMHRYRRFRVRMGGSDREQTMMRDEMAAEMARMSGFPDAQTHRPAAVYLNGVFYGMVWMKSPRTERHWSELFGGREAGFEQIGSNENGRAACGNTVCDRPVFNTSGAPIPASSDTTAGGQSVRHPQVCGGASGRCNRVADPSRADGRTSSGQRPCNWYWSNYNDPCRALGYCRGTGQNFQGEYRNRNGGTVSTSSLSPTNAIQGSWAEVFALARGTSLVAADGLENAANWARFQELVCIDSMMHYYALNIFGANVDWPSNNLEMWRYFPTQEELNNPNLHPHLRDGKWRFNPHDLEMGFGIWQRGMAPRSATNRADNTIHALLARPGSGTAMPNSGGLSGNDRFHYNATTSASYLMPAVLRRADMRAKMANALHDLLTASHSAENSRGVHERYRSWIQNEHRHMLNPRSSTERETRVSEMHRAGNNAGGTNWPDNGAIFGTASNAGTSGEPRGHEDVRGFLADRGTHLRGFMGNSFTHATSRGLGLPDTARNVTVSVRVQGGGTAVVNTRPIGVEHLPQIGAATIAPTTTARPDPRSAGRASPVVTDYFPGTTIPITAHAYPGFRATWTGAPGNPAAGTSRIELTSSATITINFVEWPEDPRIQNLDISTVRAESYNSNGADWIEIHNRRNVAVNTKGLYLTDSGQNNLENRFRWQIPSFVIRPGEKVYIKTSRNIFDSTAFETGTVANQATRFRKRAHMNFNIGLGDRMRIVHARDGSELVMVDVTYMTNAQVMERRNNHNFTVVAAPQTPALPCLGGCGIPNDQPCQCCILCNKTPCDCTPCGQCSNPPMQCICCNHCGQLTCDCPVCEGGCDELIQHCACCKTCNRLVGGVTCICALCSGGCGGRPLSTLEGQGCACNPLTINSPLEAVLVGPPVQSGDYNGVPRWNFDVRITAPPGTSSAQWIISFDVPPGSNTTGQWRSWWMGNYNLSFSGMRATVSSREGHQQVPDPWGGNFTRVFSFSVVSPTQPFA